MDAKDILNDIDLSKKVVDVLEEQITRKEKFLESVLGGCGKEHKDKVDHLRARINRVMRKAKEGGDWKEELEGIKKVFNQEIKK